MEKLKTKAKIPLGDRLATAFLWTVNLLVTLIIISVTVWHGEDSPFNTFTGKLMFLALFVGFPIYVYKRFSNIIGFTFSLGSLVLWTIGFGGLVALVESFGNR